MNQCFLSAENSSCLIKGSIYESYSLLRISILEEVAFELILEGCIEILTLKM